jgi:FkbM family methyltransferase
MATITRSQFLAGLGGLAAGVPLGIVAEPYLSPPVAPAPVTPAKEPAPSETSFAQSGEDLIAKFIFDYLGIADMSYLDVGAYDPVKINNTYYFYRMGFHGVLVEPNVKMCEKLREVRPRDTTLTAGIGVTAVREADYYLMTEPSWNTFSKEEADHQVKVTNGRIKIESVIKMPLLDINDVMNEHFKGAPSFLSIDAEGWHLAILKSIDFKRFRPKVICVETLVSGTNTVIKEIPVFMTSQGYYDRGGSIVNTLFVDGKLLGV